MYDIFRGRESVVRNMEYTYKFRLYPTVEQQEQMSRNFGCCRYVFNHFLAQRQEQYTLAVLGAVPRCKSSRAQRGYSSSAERRLPKPRMWVRFPLSAPRPREGLLNAYDSPERRAATSPAMAQTRRDHADVPPVLLSFPPGVGGISNRLHHARPHKRWLLYKP